MPLPENLYFIAIIPPQKLQDEITSLKQDFANRFNSKKALKVFPHLTLKTPFKFSLSMHAELLRWFNDLHLLQKQFSIQLKNFGAFENKKNPVVFVQPILTKELQSLQQQLIASFNSVFPGNVHATDLDFHPHITIAYRDLSFEMFQQAWNEYKHKSFNEIFEADAVYLLQYDSKKWNLISTHHLQRN